MPDIAEAIATSALAGEADPPAPPGLVSATFKQRVRTRTRLAHGVVAHGDVMAGSCLLGEISVMSAACQGQSIITGVALS